jgi:peptide/nickel transport system permease protein
LGRYVVRRLFHASIVLVAVSLLAFGLVYVSGDPVRALVPIDASPEDMDNVRRGFGLDRPLPVQYLRFVERALRGDLGESFKYRTNSLELVVQRLPNTILLAVASIALAVTVAIPLGVVAGSRRRSLVDTLATGLAILLISTPSFWLGILLILLGADWLGILPASGAGSVRHLVMPAMALAAASMGLVTRLVRATMADALRQRYVTTAHAKGLSPVRVHYLHALRNCLIPTVTVVGLQFGALLGGAVVVETVFAWPGVGWLLIQAINARDLPLIRSAVLVVATFVVLINLAIDLLYGVLDPRIRYT